MTKHILSILGISLIATAQAQLTGGGQTTSTTATASKARTERDFHHIGYFAFKVGIASPTNREAKSNITSQEYMNEAGLGVPFKRGQVGLQSGYTFGFTGIAPLKSINENLMPNLGVGISMDFDQTFLKYSLDELYSDPEINPDFKTGSTYYPFLMTSFGIGPSVTYRPIEDRLYIDAYFRFHLTAAVGGNYSLYYYDSENSFTVRGSVYTETAKIDLSQSFGITFRYARLMVGMDMRFGVDKKGQMYEELEAYDNDYSTEDYSESSTFDVDIPLSYIGFNLGIIIAGAKK